MLHEYKAYYVRRHFLILYKSELNLNLFFLPTIAPFNAIVSRIRGAGLSRHGFQRVATTPEGEAETVEMSAAPGPSAGR